MKFLIEYQYESEYWLELLIESGYYHDTSILNQCIEVKKMLISSINTAKNRRSISIVFAMYRSASFERGLPIFFYPE